mgnify:CR=1 FL=1
MTEGSICLDSSISIHALLAESDNNINSSVTTADKISIHALLAESDVSFMLYDTSSLIFLSTLSLRRATFSVFASPFSIFYFYPRSPCGERHNINSSVNTADKISIHALLAESDL